MHRKRTTVFSAFALVFFISGFTTVLFLSGCGSRKGSAGKSLASGKVFSVLTLDRIKQSGFLNRINPAFETANKCKVEVTSCQGSAELLDIIRNEKELRKYDLVVGLDNCFFADAKEYARFAPSKALQKVKVNPLFQFDPQQRLIPYGYGYLAVVYDETKVTQPPESFGELQDARFLNQLVVCNPRSSGIGRAVLMWTVALFGNEGYQQFWKSIKKNIGFSKETWGEALQSLTSGQSALAFGFTATPAWVLETQSNPLPLKLSLLKEGSFLYVEATAIPAKARHKALAEAYLNYLLGLEQQKYVAYNLGIFPANESTPLPASFMAAPFATYSVNDKLQAENPEANLNNWLDFWDRLFSNGLY